MGSEKYILETRCIYGCLQLGYTFCSLHYILVYRYFQTERKHTLETKERWWVALDMANISMSNDNFYNLLIFNGALTTSNTIKLVGLEHVDLN